jgi:pyruvate, orthophosphate dikinase
VVARRAITALADATARPCSEIDVSRYRRSPPVAIQHDEGDDVTVAGSARYVHSFADGDRSQLDLLGGKGANLAEMVQLGLPVPPGFTVTTDACRIYLTSGAPPEQMWDEIAEHLRELERESNRRLGDGTDPLLVSVRSGARFSMPGMMETVLNVGLNDVSVEGLAAAAGSARFAWDSYRRLIQMFGRTVAGVPADNFTTVLESATKDVGGGVDGLDSAALKELSLRFLDVYREHAGEDFPQDPQVQLRRAVTAVFESWNSERARVYRRRERIPADLGTAVNVMAMVYGNLGADSGTGVAFTRDPVTGAAGLYGDYLAQAQGEDVVAGVRNTIPIQHLEQLNPDAYRRLTQIAGQLERHYRDLCDLEFTMQRGRLWMLQVRVGKRAAAAAFTIAAQLAADGLIDLDEALRRVNGEQLAQLLFPTLDLSGAPERLVTGVGASPGAAVGRVVFDSARAVELAEAGEAVILVRRETNPDDLPGILAARGVLTSRGGKTSHAAVVARGVGRACVCGASDAVVDQDERRFSVHGRTVREGDLLSLDGATGAVYLGALTTQESTLLRSIERGVQAGDPLLAAVQQLLAHADARARLGVRANADTPADAERARALGARGVGLCRTEHLFLGERRLLIERLILAATSAERQQVLDELLPLQRQDFTGILRAMSGLPVTIRLIDPPLHEFLPSLEELAVRVAVAEATAAVGPDRDRDRNLLAAVRRMHEANPMLGLRGVRLGLVMPGLFEMQVTAIAQAAVAVAAEGGDPRPQIMVPLVAAAEELRVVRAQVEQAVGAVAGAPLIPIGTMIEVPRAAMTAERIAGVADFFSFGTNDLTQLSWGFSRDDVEGAFFPHYLDMRIFAASPFETIDTEGVGRLIELAVREGRVGRPGLQAGVCGEQGGDPASIRFFHQVGLDYVSCSPFRVVVARLEAGRAGLEHPDPAGHADPEPDRGQPV